MDLVWGLVGGGVYRQAHLGMAEDDPSGVSPARPPCPHCSSPTPTPTPACLSPDLCEQDLLGSPSFTKQLQGKGKDPSPKSSESRRGKKSSW